MLASAPHMPPHPSTRRLPVNQVVQCVNTRAWRHTLELDAANAIHLGDFFRFALAHAMLGWQLQTSGNGNKCAPPFTEYAMAPTHQAPKLLFR